jgi:putative glutamine amidotransferase
MNRGKPVIAVSGPDKGGTLAWLMTAWAVRRCGGIPLRLRPASTPATVKVHGIVLTGGSDVDPIHYGQAINLSPPRRQHHSPIDYAIALVLGALRLLFAAHQRQDFDPDRDHLESCLVKNALYQRLPLLGICRGAQLMNVVAGGSLHQRLDDYYSEGTGNIRCILPCKQVSLRAGSLLARLLEADQLYVNALHDQSIDQTGDGIAVCAREDNGIVQAIEHTDHPFFLGVQWHPEYMPQKAGQLRLFHGLIRSARQCQAITITVPD